MLPLTRSDSGGNTVDLGTFERADESHWSGRIARRCLHRLGMSSLATTGLGNRQVQADLFPK